MTLGFTCVMIGWGFSFPVSLVVYAALLVKRSTVGA